MRSMNDRQDVKTLGRLRDNLIASLQVPPWHAPAKAWLPVPFFALISVLVGFQTGLLELAPLNSEAMLWLPITLLIFPSLLEEAFFRGVLIPRNVERKGPEKTWQAIVLSSLAFVVWHPLNALTFNTAANPLFLDPAFLIIVTLLGLTCGYGYVRSRSLWVPIIIHWATVTVWVLFLGGRNLVLEL